MLKINLQNFKKNKLFNIKVNIRNKILKTHIITSAVNSCIGKQGFIILKQFIKY